MAGAGVTRSGNFFSIVGIEENWTAEEIFQVSGLFVDIKIKSIELHGGSDIKGSTSLAVIRQGGTSGARICTLATPNIYTVSRAYFGSGGQYMKPFLDYDDSHLPFLVSGHTLIFEVA